MSIEMPTRAEIASAHDAVPEDEWWSNEIRELMRPFYQPNLNPDEIYFGIRLGLEIARQRAAKEQAE